MARDRFAPPTLVVLAAGAALIMLLFVIAIVDTGDVWLVPLTVVALGLIALAIVVELRRVIAATGEGPVVETPPGRAIVVSTTPMTAAEVFDALGPTGADASSIMVVCPAGLRGHGPLAEEHDYARALRAETATVAALRRAGIKAAGTVGERNPAHAIDDALDLFPASTVVVVAREHEADIYREHLDRDELQRRQRVELHVREAE